jgi:RHS repeat-associated protein
MISDKNKGITSIKYNHQNLPTEIIFTATKKINYLYNALGAKIQKTVTNGTAITITDYLGGYQYLKEGTAAVALKFFPHPEGYVNFDAGVYKHVFNFVDHIGNVRMSFTKNQSTGLAEAMEENHYYPFGLKHTSYNVGIMKLRGSDLLPALENPYKYRYNGKEFQNELGLNVYNYGFRNYMPDIGRWMSVDPLLNDLDFKFDPNDVDKDNDDEVVSAIQTTLGNGGGIFNTDNLNPYSYGYNDPVRFDDPDGRCPPCIAGIYLIAALLVPELANAPTMNPAADAKGVGNGIAIRNEVLSIAVTPAGIGGGRTVVGTVLKAQVKKEATKQVKKQVEKATKTYQTYTKEPKNPADGVYSGKTSGTNTPKKNVENRDRNHHKNETHGPAKLDKSSTNEKAIRGQEQNNIKNNGGARSEGGTSGNARNSVSPNNPKAGEYKAQAATLPQ